MDADLLDVLAARKGLVCAVGAGGKKSLLYRLAMLHPGRVALTSTVLIPPFPPGLEACVIVAEADSLAPAVVEAAAQRRRVAFAQPSPKRARLGGVPGTTVREIHTLAGFDVTLVKADGARSRWVKAPDADEPQIPEGADTVIPVVSARALGTPLSESIAHHVPAIVNITGAVPEEPLEPIHLARLLASEEGLLKGAGHARVIPVINMVDGPAQEALARRTAELALELSQRFELVVLACLRRAEALVGVVRRQQ